MTSPPDFHIRLWSTYTVITTLTTLVITVIKKGLAMPELEKKLVPLKGVSS